MIVLDTNVISEPTKLIPNESVVNWLSSQDRGSVYITSVSLAEVLAGIALLPDGKRKVLLHKSVEEMLERHIQTPVLSFDEAAAVSYASLLKVCKSNHYTMAVPDAQIAAIAAVHGFTVATRDVDPFRAAGLAVVNPWEAL